MSKTNPIQNACKTLVIELKCNKEFYNAFVASIKSVLYENIDHWDEQDYEELAQRIADRIIGKE